MEPRELPASLFKYYSLNEEFNKAQLNGEVYLSSPLQFNDPLDCQLNVYNNIDQIQLSDPNEAKRIKSRIAELGYAGSELDAVIKDLSIPDLGGIKSQTKIDREEEVKNKQLEKLGVLCLSPNPANSLMWAHYSHNKGFCIQYNTSILIRNMVLQFINKLDAETTKKLLTRYKEKPNCYYSKLKGNLHFFSQEVSTTNEVLLSEESDIIKNFIYNFYIGRFACYKMNYVEQLPRKGAPLFFDRKQKEIEEKYFSKLQEWQYEDEYRLSLSLAGNTSLSLGSEAMESIILGNQISRDQVLKVITMLIDHNITRMPLFKIEIHDQSFVIEKFEKTKLYTECRALADRSASYFNI